MDISIANITRTCAEKEIYESLLPLDHHHIVELGCGRAEITRAIATSGTQRKISALEVDSIQHHYHLSLNDLPNVTFIQAGAESIPLNDASADVVMMFKSLHHVPLGLMKTAMQEIQRVLKNGGYLYISEPIFAGDFNEILQLFHNEKQVREAAFHAIVDAIDCGLFQMQEQIFFNTPMHFDHFTDFEQKVLKATHTEHQLSEQLYHTVQEAFAKHTSPTGANFNMPIRVDLLRKA
ncbi:MAG: methyltransferase domain-containing protein [Zetaproteobacteria bacterium]|nr:methyltransferase domain-containing protein [Zetaproteobacteria bacterium]